MSAIMSMAQLITVRLNKSDHQPLGFRLQGGKDFGTPLVVQKVNGGSAAERAGLQAGDALIRVNNTDVFTLRHQDAQDTIRAAGANLELTVQRGGGTWRPSVTPTGSLPRPGSRPLGGTPTPVTNTSLKANPQPSRNFGSGHNNVAKPFGYMNGNDTVKSVVNKQYNTPVNIYSDKTIAETLSAQTEVLAGGVLGVNFKKNEKTYDAEKSAVFKVLQEEQNDPEPEVSTPTTGSVPPVSGLRHVQAPVTRPDAPVNNTGGLPPGQNICEECERLITKARSTTASTFEITVCCGPAEPSHFYSRASVARAGSPGSLARSHRSRSRTPRVMVTPAPDRASTGTQTATEQHAPPKVVLPEGVLEALPDGRVALAPPPAPRPATGSLPILNDTPYCSDCNRYIVGVFVRIKDKNLHVECFKCSTCGSSLKNQGYYNINGKLYCDIHAKLVARQNPPAPNLDPVTVPPGGRVPTNTYSTPLPPLSTNNYSNGSSSLFSPSSNLSGPKPFGSSVGSAYSPSLSPRSAPLSPRGPSPRPPRPPPHPSPPNGQFPFLKHSCFIKIVCSQYYSSRIYVQKAFSFINIVFIYFSFPVSITYLIMLTAQNVKSIVWPPPPNAPEDEPPKYEALNRSPMQRELKTRQVITPDMSNEDDKVQKTSNIQREILSAEQKREISSSVSYTAAVSSASSSSHTKSESILNNSQAQIVQETTSCAIQSFSQESSCVSQNLVYQTSTGSQQPPKIYESNENIQKAEMSVSKETSAMAIKSSNDQNINLCQVKDALFKPNAENSVNQTSNTQEDQKMFLNEDNLLKTVSNQFIHEKQIAEKYNSNTEVMNSTRNETGSFVETQNPMQISSSDKNRQLQETVKETMTEALTIAPNRPYSPLPVPQPLNVKTELYHQEKNEHLSNKTIQYTSVQQNQNLPNQPSPIFTQQPKRAITPIPPIKTYNPPEKVETPIAMPPETTPYIPEDFKITVEPRVEREATSSPFVEALTTAPERPYTPVNINAASIERGSLRDALTIAPDRPYSPLPVNIANQFNHTSTSSLHVQTAASEIVKPVATQSFNNQVVSDQMNTELSNMQNTYNLQSSSEMSAFKPVSKQILMPPQTQDTSHYSNVISERNIHETTMSESTIMQQSAFKTSSGFSSVKSAQNYFEHLDKKETLSSSAVRSISGLHKPDNIPLYQKNFEKLPSQRGISPDMYKEKPVLQRPVTPSTDPPNKQRDKSKEPKDSSQKYPEVSTAKIPQNQTPIYQIQPQTPLQFHKDTPITMTFQPVTDDNFMRNSPIRSRPSTPSLINKPAPIIPHYQMNLVTVEHLAPESHLYDPSSPEASRSPTPKPRSRSPAPGPPPNPLKAQAPRIREPAHSHSLLTQATANLRKEHESQQKQSLNVEFQDRSCEKKFVSDPSSMIKEQTQSNFGYKSENYAKGDISIKEDSMMAQNFGQRQMQSQNVSEFGHTTVQTTRKTFEEFERTQSAKTIEIRKGGSSFGDQQFLNSNIHPSAINAKPVFPPPSMTLPTQEMLSVNSSNYLNNENNATASRNTGIYKPKPLNSGANQGPVCDPTPSTGSSVGAATRGKTFGVSSAPKRGRGILNKPALPGSRVPLCASCNGNISSQKPEFKSQAEERLIRKMAKMALNGYEIGIQRKIKPADHIQSMADKIQDTVVTKHPLNTDGSSEENIRENSTLRKISTNDNVYKNTEFGSMNDRVKESNFLNSIIFNGSTPVPPPLPTSPIPTFNIHSTPLGEPIVTGNMKKQSDLPKNFNIDYGLDFQNETLNGSLNDNDFKIIDDHKNTTNTLKKTNGFQNSFLNGMNSTKSEKKPDQKFENNIYSNTLNKRKLFENKDDTNNFKHSPCDLKNEKKIIDVYSKANNSNQSFKLDGHDLSNTTEETKPAVLPSSVKDNSLVYDAHDSTTVTDDPPSKVYDTDNDTFTESNTLEKIVNNTEEVVRRRQKKNIRNDDGRRDSHIIARPLSTMTSVDVEEGMYPVCHICDKAITRGPFITALGRIWCPEHFICVNATCRRPLQDIGFVEENGQLYCEFCFEQYIAPACDKCHAKIKGDCLNAIGKHFHPECFNCVYCGKLFGNNPFFLEDGLPYCEADWNELFTTKCFACGFPVEAGDRWVEALNNNYHSQCFNCTVCKKNLEGQSFFAKGGRPFCKTHAR
uniref:PDZ and LIM domain protein Zasp n=1 Tax=Bombyx mori TaxID=7091 RepID=A0A8R2R3L2_BOMMO|nr:PDZ and LIM domain protein Zasp [Bombyx mori]